MSSKTRNEEKRGRGRSRRLSRERGATLKRDKKKRALAKNRSRALRLTRD